MLTNWEDPFVVQWMDQNRARYGDDGWGLMMAAKAAYEDREKAQAQASGAQMVPQDVVNYFQNLQQTQSNTYNPDGREWFAIGEDGGRYLGGNPAQISGYRQSTEYGRPVSEVGNADNYFDANGIFQATQKNERSATWGELIAQLAASVAGIGAVGAAAGVPLGTAGATGGTAMGTNGAFLGEGASSGIGAWDGALTTAEAAGAAGGAGYGNGAFLGEGTQGAGVWGADGSVLGGGTTAMGASGSGGVPAAGGTPPPANPYLTGGGAGGGTLGSIQNILGGTGTASDWLGLAGTALGALGGAQGQEASTTSTRAMDPRMDALFYGDLAPRTQGLLASTTPQAQLAGGQLMAKGSGLLGQTEPTTASNPYLKSIADDMQRRTTDMLGTNNLAIQGNAVGVGGLGGSRQGVAQGLAASKAADYLQGNVAGLYGNAYNADQNRLRQDWTLGSGMLSQGINMPFAPAQSTAQIYSPFTGTGTTTNSSQTGGGWMGAVGGALGAAQAGKNLGWW